MFAAICAGGDIQSPLRLHSTRPEIVSEIIKLYRQLIMSKRCPYEVKIPRMSSMIMLLFTLNNFYRED